MMAAVHSSMQVPMIACSRSYRDMAMSRGYQFMICFVLCQQAYQDGKLPFRAQDADTVTSDQPTRLAKVPRPNDHLTPFSRHPVLPTDTSDHLCRRLSHVIISENQLSSPMLQSPARCHNHHVPAIAIAILISTTRILDI